MSDKIAIRGTHNDSPRVVHVVENLNRAAVENWLVRMLRFAVEQGVQLDWTFYCILGAAGQLDNEVRKLGGRIVYSPVALRSTREFIRALRQELATGGYDVLHCHHDLVSAVYLVAAAGLPIRTRLVHAHNADESLPTSNRLKHAILRPMLRGACLLMADRIVGNSKHTLDTFLAGRKRRAGKDMVHYYGVDGRRFENVAVDPIAFRRNLRFSDDVRIVLFAGRMVPEKNPIFAVEVLAEMHRRDPAVVGVFVGDGGLSEAVRGRARELGLVDCFRFLGWRNDVPEVMACCDCFVLPHPEQAMEGFGLAIVEAQLAGLRMLLSNGIADDPLLPDAVFRRLPLDAGKSRWAEVGLQLVRQPTRSREAALLALQRSPFEMKTAFRHLQLLHT